MERKSKRDKTMKKRVVLLVTALCGLMAFSSCSFLTPPGGQNSSDVGTIPPNSSQAARYTVTFKQDGQADIVREVNAGEAVTDVPTPAGKVGYTVTWDGDGDLTNVTEDLIVTAVATANKYQITYDVNGGDALTANTQEVTFDAVTTLVTPTYDGYTFTGWVYEKDGATLPVVSETAWKIAEDVTLVAQWTKATTFYTVTFAQEGYQAVQVQVEEGKGVPADQIPVINEKTGYTIVWDTTKDLTNVTGNMTVNAVETANKYTITYNVNGGDALTANTQEVTYDADYTLVTPTYDGYTFKGWKNNGNAMAATGKWTIADNVTLVAEWEKVIVYYTVTFKQAGVTDVTVQVEEGTAVPADKIPTINAKTGYTVVWDTTKDLTNVTADMTVNAVETANTYTITYDVNGGNALTSNTQEVTYDAAYTLATPTYDGYTFTCWTYNGNVVTSGAKWAIADNVTLVAQWTALYSVTFVQEGQPMQTFTVEDGDMFDKSLIPNVVAKTGYTVNWNAEDLAKLDAPITGAVKVNAVETANKYTITYNVNGGDALTANTQEVTYDADYTLVTPTYDGYTFKGWKNNGNAMAATGKWTIADNVTLVAEWEKVIVYYTVTFKQAGVTDVTVQVEEGTAVPADKIPTINAKTGYTVVWDTTKDLTNVTADMTVNAVETANTYTITYDVNGGNALTSNTQEVTYDAAYTLATPTYDGYTFTCWTYNGNVVTSGEKWTIADDVTLVATWTKETVYYTVTFVQEGQENKVFERVEANTAFTNIPEVVTQTGYVIAWKAEDLAKLANVTENVVVTATVQAKQYNVVLNADGGTVGGAASTQQSVTYGADYELATPTREGYEFKGWTYNGQKVDTKGTWAIDAETIELKAEWEKLPDEDDNWTQNY